MKLSLLAGTLGVLSAVVTDAAAQVAVITAALTGVGWVLTRIVLPATKTLKRTYKAVGALEDLGSFMDETRVQDALTDRRLDLLERHMHLFAAEDAANVRRAIRPEESP